MEELLKRKSICNQPKLIVQKTLYLGKLSGWLQCVFLFSADLALRRVQWKKGNTFFSLPKCKVLFVRYYLTWLSI